MNYYRILFFSVILYVLNIIAVATVTFFFVDVLESSSVRFVLLQQGISAIVSLSVFVVLAFKQAEKPYKHSVFVAGLSWIISLSIDSVFRAYIGLEFEPLVLFVPLLLTIVGVIVGTTIGIKMRQESSIT